MDFGVYDAGLEVRQENGRETITGSFPYNSLAIISDRGGVRKERFGPRAFRYAVDDPARRIELLRGHSFDHPLASRQAGTLELDDTDEALNFRATLPEEMPSWVEDTVRAVRGGLMVGLSPGFRVPPRGVVPDAEQIDPEPGNPGVSIRTINHAVLRELSIVTSAAYLDATVEMRSDELHRSRRILWL